MQNELFFQTLYMETQCSYQSISIPNLKSVECEVMSLGPLKHGKLPATKQSAYQLWRTSQAAVLIDIFTNKKTWTFIDKFVGNIIIFKVIEKGYILQFQIWPKRPTHTHRHGMVNVSSFSYRNTTVFAGCHKNN